MKSIARPIRCHPPGDANGYTPVCRPAIAIERAGTTFAATRGAPARGRHRARRGTRSPARSRGSPPCTRARVQTHHVVDRPARRARDLGEILAVVPRGDHVLARLVRRCAVVGARERSSDRVGRRAVDEHRPRTGDHIGAGQRARQPPRDVGGARAPGHRHEQRRLTERRDVDGLHRGSNCAGGACEHACAGEGVAHGERDVDGAHGVAVHAHRLDATRRRERDRLPRARPRVAEHRAGLARGTSVPSGAYARSAKPSRAYARPRARASASSAPPPKPTMTRSSPAPSPAIAPSSSARATTGSLCASWYSAPCGFIARAGTPSRVAIFWRAAHCASIDAASAPGSIAIDTRPKPSRSGYDGCAATRAPRASAKLTARAIDAASPACPPHATFATVAAA